MKRTTITILLLAVLLGGCQKPEPAPMTETLPMGATEPMTHCVNKQDSDLNITFSDSAKEEARPNAYFPGLTVYHITDINGKHWSVNEFEMENYICTPYSTGS